MSKIYRVELYYELGLVHEPIGVYTSLERAKEAMVDPDILAFYDDDDYMRILVWNQNNKIYDIITPNILVKDLKGKTASDILVSKEFSKKEGENKTRVIITDSDGHQFYLKLSPSNLKLIHFLEDNEWFWDGITIQEAPADSEYKEF